MEEQNYLLKQDLRRKIVKNIEYNESVYKVLAQNNLVIQKEEHSDCEVIDEYNRLKKYYFEKNKVEEQYKKNVLESLNTNDKELIDLELELIYLKNIYEHLRYDLQISCGDIIKLLQNKNKNSQI